MPVPTKTTVSKQEVPAVGRPRSEDSRLAILAAARALVAESRFSKLSIEGIARRAKVSKATIYRWWPSKAAVVLEAMREAGGTGGYPMFQHTGDARQDLLDELRRVITFYNETEGQGLLDLIAESRFDPDLADAVRDRFVVFRRKDTIEVMRAGMAKGTIRPDLDVETVMDALWGAVYYKLLVSHTPVSPDYADDLFETFWPAIGQPHGRGRKALGGSARG